MARDIVIEERPTYIVGRGSLLAALATGAFVGFFGWLFTIAINSWVLHPVFCRSADTSAVCASADMTSWIIAHIIVSIIGLFMLIRANVFRPLLIVLAALVTLWAVGLWFVSAAWWVGLLWGTVLFALAYALYTWLASAKRFLLALVTIIILVVLFRLLVIL